MSAAAGLAAGKGDPGLPASVLLPVPFAPQAPFADWSPPFDEACEEASLLLAEFALRGEPLSKERMAEEIRRMVAWEEGHGYPIDVTIAELAEIARAYFGRSATVYGGKSVTIDTLKDLLAAGHPVIVPAAGQRLGNPYFSGEGPPYHMLVLRGYEEGGFFSGEQFITNDPGTKRGEEYRYDADVLLAAIHDWTGAKETIESGRRAVLVIGE